MPLAPKQLPPPPPSPLPDALSASQDFQYNRIGIRSAQLGNDFSFGYHYKAPINNDVTWRNRKTKIEELEMKVKSVRKKVRGDAAAPSICMACIEGAAWHKDEIAKLKRKANHFKNQTDTLRKELDAKLEEMEELKTMAADEKKQRLSVESKNAYLARKVVQLTKDITTVRSEGLEATKSVQSQLVALQEIYACLKAEFEEVQRELEVDPVLCETEETEADLRDYKALFKAVCAEIGLTDALTLPSREFNGDTNKDTALRNWRCRTARHLAAVLRGRDMACVVEALKRTDFMQKLLDLPEVRRMIATEVVRNIQDHWGARLAVHLWDRLDLSRSQYDTLRHILTFIYDPETDKYNEVKVWQNPEDPDDFVAMAKLVGRRVREGEYNRIVEEAGIVVSTRGSCSRDTVRAAGELYTNYKDALRTNFSKERPALPVLYVDGTGQSLSKALCHCEMGCADFTGECLQSRKTLQPLAAYADTDHTMPLREHLAFVARSYNELIKDQIVTLEDGTTIPSKPIASADMQGVKSLTAQSESSHSVWCKCDGAEGGPQHKYPTITLDENPANISASYAKMLQAIEKNKDGPRCSFKTFDEICCFNHFSPGVARGGKFTRFKCSCCGYSPSESQWRRDLEEFDKLEPDEQKQRRKDHNEVGKAIHDWERHQMGTLFLSPLLHLDMVDIGVDQLHLIYLNIFKHLFKYTVHDAAPDTVKRTVIKDYISEAGFYSYDAAADDEDPCKRWIGREVKRFLAEAHKHVPFLLNVAHAPVEVCKDTINAMDDITNGEWPHQ